MSDAYKGWAIVELMGHRQRAGKVSEAEQYGARLLRIDIPAGDEIVTEYYGGGAIYALRPCSKDLALAIAGDLGDVRPPSPNRYRLPAPEPDDNALCEDEDLGFVIEVAGFSDPGV